MKEAKVVERCEGHRACAGCDGRDGGTAGHGGLRRFVALCLILAMIVTAAACSNKDETGPTDADVENPGDEADPGYTVMEPAVLSDSMEEATAGGFTGQYDADLWHFDESLGFALYDKAIFESGNPDGKCPNVTVVVSNEFEGPFTEEDLSELGESMQSGGMGYALKTQEMRLFQDEPVLYYEAETKITEEMIQTMLEEGALTQETVETLGGVEAMMDMASNMQSTVCAIIDGRVVVFTATYYDEASQAATMEGIKALIQTGAVGAVEPADE